MAVPVVEDSNTRLQDMEGAVSGTTSIGSGAGAGTFVEAIYQGLQTWGRKIGSTAALRGFFVSFTAQDMRFSDQVIMWKASLVNSAAIHSIGLQARVGASTTDYYGYVIHDDGTQGDNAEFQYPIKDAWIIIPINPNVEAWRDEVAGSVALNIISEVGFAGAVTVTTVNENMIADAIDLSNGLFITRGDGADPDATFQDLVDDDEGTVTAGRFGHYATRDGIIFVFGTTVVGRAVAGAANNDTEFTDAFKTLVFPGGLVDAGWNGLSFDITPGGSIVSLDTVTVIGRGRTNLKEFFDSELEVTGGATDTITIPGHGFVTGDYVLYSARGGTVVGGLTDDTNYFLRRVDADTVAVYAVGTTVGRQNAFTDTSRISLTAATAGNGENHSLRRSPDTRPDIVVESGFLAAVSTDATTRAMSSPDGINWTSRTAPAQQWLAMTYGKGAGLFVAVSQGGGTGRFASSPDGITWTIRTAPSTVAWTAVTYGAGQFVAVANSGTTNAVAVSSDGVTWTGRTAAEGNQWGGVAYGNGLFAAVARSGINRVMTSPDGVTWTSRSASQNNLWEDVVYANGLFVAVSSDGTNRVMTSPDGINWTNRIASAAQQWQAVAHGNGLFVAVALSGQSMFSEDGISWTAGASLGGSYKGLAFDGHQFVAVGSAAAPNTVKTSPDGNTWTVRTASAAVDWRGVAAGPGTGTGDFTADGCVFNATRKIALARGASLLSCSMVNSQMLIPGNGVVDSCVISGATLPPGEAYLVADEPLDLDKVTNNTFTMGASGHAVELLESSLDVSIDYAGNTHVGYGNGSANGSGVHDNEFDSTTDVNATTDVVTVAGDPFVTGEPIFYSQEGGSANIGLTDGNLYYVRRDSANTYGVFESADAANTDTNRIALTSTGGETHTLYSANAAFHNPTGKTITLNISGGGDTPSVRNSNGSTTIIVNAVTVTFATMKDNSEVRVYLASTGAEIAGIEDATAGSADNRTFVWSAAPGTVVDYEIINFQSGVPTYEIVEVHDFTVPSVNTTIPIQQSLNRNVV